VTKSHKKVIKKAVMFLKERSEKTYEVITARHFDGEQPHPKG